ncbi:MAG TPA: class I SAM-dependent methyltransferase [Thermoanaerobaculia bacterium]|nr:class I SAM-dependent methyltransferase [Thermoanaerobaculia bacterium]
MSVTLLFPSFDHPAIEERYGSWQNRLLLRASQPGAPVRDYDASHTLQDPATTIESDFVLVVTDPIFVPSPRLIDLLVTALDDHPSAFAVVPLANESENKHQRRSPAQPYLTLRQFEETAETIAQEPALRFEIEWDESDPAVFLCRTRDLQTRERLAPGALAGETVVVVTNAYIHRFSSHRGQLRGDLLERIHPEVTSMLEFGCGEASLGAALKARQPCRVVGIELDPEAAVVARSRIDEVLSGDVRELIGAIDERFDYIVGGDILEHLDDPWTFLRELRRVANPGAHLLLSIPNIASWPIVADLLRGRFDYVYMGITCAGHLRFFTRRTIEEMLEIAGWGVASITPQESFITPEYLALEQRLDGSGIAWSREDLITPGYYVIAVNGLVPGDP